MTTAYTGLKIKVTGHNSTRLSSIEGSFYSLDFRGPIYKITYDYLTIMRKLRSTYDGRLIYKTSYEGRKAFLMYDSLAKL